MLFAKLNTNLRGCECQPASSQIRFRSRIYNPELFRLSSLRHGEPRSESNRQDNT